MFGSSGKSSVLSFAALGAMIFTGTGLYLFHEASTFLKGSLRTEATVIGFSPEAVHRAARSIFEYTVEFRDELGRPQRSVMETRTCYIAGETTAIAYDPIDPSRVRDAGFRERWLVPTLFLLAGIACLLVLTWPIGSKLRERFGPHLAKEHARRVLIHEREPLESRGEREDRGTPYALTWEEAASRERVKE